MRTIFFLVLASLVLAAFAAFGLGLDAGAFELERSSEISAPASVVFAQLDDLHRWNDWFPWTQIDKHVTEHVHSGAPKGVGASYEWQSDNKSGRNRLTILESQPPNRVLARLEFTQGRSREFRLLILLTAVADGTKVRIVMSGPDTYASKFFGRYKEYMVKDLERGLQNLAKLSTSKR
jgi:uncharacterized protein YndB with AHSA1/START domain